jgi:hypothetical protein
MSMPIPCGECTQRERLDEDARAGIAPRCRAEKDVGRMERGVSLRSTPRLSLYFPILEEIEPSR